MICFYHRGDFDGHCSGAIVRHRHPDCLMVGVEYGEPFPWHMLPKEDEPKQVVVMCDFSLPIPEMERLKEQAHMLIWIDHHYTAIEAAQAAGFMTPGLRAVGQAACELTWEFFFTGEPMPLPVRLLGRYDVFDLDGAPRILDFQFGLKAYRTDVGDPETVKIWNLLINGGSERWVIIANLGHWIRNYQEVQDEKYMRRFAFWTRLEDLAALAVNNGAGGSMKFEADPRAKEAPLLISFAKLPAGEKWLVNLYTFREDVHCGEIASIYGGGGHQKAAGFITPELPFEIRGQ